MNGREGFTSLVRRGRVSPADALGRLATFAPSLSRLKLSAATTDARLQTLHFRDIAIGRYNGDRFQRDGLIRLDQVNKRAIVVSLNGVVRQERDTFVRIDQRAGRLRTGSGRVPHHRS